MDAKDKLRLPGLAGLTLLVMIVINFIMDFTIIGTTGGKPMIDVVNIGPDLLRAQGSLIWPLATWLYVFMIVPFPVFAFGVYWALRSERDEGLPAVGLGALTLFWIFHTIHNATVVTVLQVFVPRYAAGAPGSQAIETVASGLIGFGNTLSVPGGGVSALLLVIGMTCLGRATLRNHQLPRWTGYAALGCAVLSLLGYLQYLSFPFFFLGLGGWVLSIVWLAGVSMRLVWRPAAATAQSGPLPASYGLR